ncbi:MAG: single-stranded-DNA-specific exonuclease RecJ [Pyrinomonadaceae bacterium]|nr:single-stranded-DNA-specific exonuclease RecJ [Pyrinomonadaceae bacterium]
MKHRSHKQWIVRGYDKAASAELARRLGTSRTIAGLLTARGITDEAAAQRFLHPALDHLHDPLLMLGMSQAVERILRAVDRGERVLIYGDYDVDGTTGTVILRRALQLLGAHTGYHIPHRFTEGYGVHKAALARASAEGYKLVISVDCGIRAHEALAWAVTRNLDCIVTDHHLPDPECGPPPAHAVVNPNQKGCPYPDKNLAGVGVAFKLVHALLRARGHEDLVPGFLKVVAIGTVADVVSLTGENRIIVALGLADLLKATNPGLRALMELAGLRESPRAVDLGFRIGPRINAAGRMDAAVKVVELFEATTALEAQALAQQLEARNRERKVMQDEITQRALREVEASADASSDGSRARVAVVVGEDWHRGVIGLAASKIAERLNRPTIVISLDGDTGHGSARSIDAYHLLDGLTSCADLMERFGGHAHAAGLVIKREHIPELRRRLNKHADMHLSDADLVPVLHVDAELIAEELTLDFVDQLDQLEPFGAGWARPVFVTRNLRMVGQPRVLKERHLKICVADAHGHSMEALWWGGAETGETQTFGTSELVDLAYQVEKNTWRGETRLQLIVRDLHSAHGGGVH